MSANIAMLWIGRTYFSLVAASWLESSEVIFCEDPPEVDGRSERQSLVVM